jgi:hypothetical protein
MQLAQGSILPEQQTWHPGQPLAVKYPFWHAAGLMLLLFILLAAMAGLAGCASGRGAATNPPLDTTEQMQIDIAARRAVVPFTPQVETAFGVDRTVTITATVGWTAQISIGDVVQEQERVKDLCFREQMALWTSGVHLQRVNVIVLGPVQDDYADMILDAHARADLTAPTAATLHWAALDPDTGWTRYDAVWLRATYQPHVVGS